MKTLWPRKIAGSRSITDSNIFGGSISILTERVSLRAERISVGLAHMFSNVSQRRVKRINAKCGAGCYTEAVTSWHYVEIHMVWRAQPNDVLLLLLGGRVRIKLLIITRRLSWILGMFELCFSNDQSNSHNLSNS